MRTNDTFCFVCLLVAGLSGCAGEASQPLTQSAVDKALAPPELSALRVQAKSLHHPRLQPVTVGQGDGITPQEAAVLAVLANPSLRSIRDGRGLAAAQLFQAGLLPNPSLEVGNDFPFAGPDTLIAYSGAIKWDISSLIAREAKLDAAKATADSVDLDIAWQEWQVAQSARAAVYHSMSLGGQLALAADVDQRLKENLASIQQAVERRLKTEIDLAAAETASQEAHANVLSLQSDLAKQRLALNRLLGLAPETNVPISSGASLPSRLTVPPAGELQKGLDQRRLDLLALRHGYDSQEAAVRAAVLGRFPKTNLGAGSARDTTGTYTVGYSASVDLPIFDRNQGAIAVEKATRQKLFDEFVNRVFEGRSEIASAVEEIGGINEEIAHAQASLPAMERLVSSYEKALSERSVDILSYYGARNDLAKKRMEILKLKQELVDTWISLENAAGQYLPDAPAPGGPE